MLHVIPLFSMFRSDPVIVFASWALIITIIVGTALLALWLHRRDQRTADAATVYLPVMILNNKAPYSEYVLYRAYIPEQDRDFVSSKLKLGEERIFERLSPGDVVRLQQILEKAYVAWVNDGRPS